MEPAAKGTAPDIITEKIVAATEEIAAEAKEEITEAPSRLISRARVPLPGPLSMFSYPLSFQEDLLSAARE